MKTIGRVFHSHGDGGLNLLLPSHSVSPNWSGCTNSTRRNWSEEAASWCQTENQPDEAEHQGTGSHQLHHQLHQQQRFLPLLTHSDSPCDDPLRETLNLRTRVRKLTWKLLNIWEIFPSTRTEISRSRWEKQSIVSCGSWGRTMCCEVVGRVKRRMNNPAWFRCWSREKLPASHFSKV